MCWDKIWIGSALYALASGFRRRAGSCPRSCHEPKPGHCTADGAQAGGEAPRHSTHSKTSSPVGTAQLSQHNTCSSGSHSTGSHTPRQPGANLPLPLVAWMAFPSALPSHEPLSFWDAWVSAGKAGRAACWSQRGFCAAGELQGEQDRGLGKAGRAPLRLPPSGLLPCDNSQPSCSAPLQEVCSCHPISHLPPLSLQAGEVAAWDVQTKEARRNRPPLPLSSQLVPDTCGGTSQQSAYRKESLRAALVVWFALRAQACSRLFANKPTIPSINPLFVAFPHPSARGFVSCAAWGTQTADSTSSARGGEVGAPEPPALYTERLCRQKQLLSTSRASLQAHLLAKWVFCIPCCSLLSSPHCRAENQPFHSFPCGQPVEKPQWGGRSVQRQVAGDEPLPMVIKGYMTLSSPRATGNGLREHTTCLHSDPLPSLLPSRRTDGNPRGWNSSTSLLASGFSITHWGCLMKGQRKGSWWVTPAKSPLCAPPPPPTPLLSRSRHKYGAYSAALMIGMDAYCRWKEVAKKTYDNNGTFHTFGTSPARTSKPWGSQIARWVPSKAHYFQEVWMNLANSLIFTDRQVPDI